MTTQEIQRHLGGLNLQFSGYQTCSTVFRGLPGIEITSSGPGTWVPATYGHELRAVEGKIVYGVRRSTEKLGEYTFEVRHEAATLEEMAAYLRTAEVGKPSEGGQPAGFQNVWD